VNLARAQAMSATGDGAARLAAGGPRARSRLARDRDPERPWRTAYFKDPWRARRGSDRSASTATSSTSAGTTAVVPRRAGVLGRALPRWRAELGSPRWAPRLRGELHRERAG